MPTTAPRESGGTGRRAGFRFQCRKACGFESRLSHSFLARSFIECGVRLRSGVALPVSVGHDRSRRGGGDERAGGPRWSDRHESRPWSPVCGIEPELVRPHWAACRTVPNAKPAGGPWLGGMDHQIVSAARRHHHQSRHHGQQQLTHDTPPFLLSAFSGSWPQRKSCRFNFVLPRVIGRPTM